MWGDSQPGLLQTTPSNDERWNQKTYSHSCLYPTSPIISFPSPNIFFRTILISLSD